MFDRAGSKSAQCHDNFTTRIDNIMRQYMTIYDTI